MAGNPVSAQFFVSALHKSFDSRLNVGTLLERDGINGTFRYKGMIVYVKEVDKYFQFNFSAPETAGEYANNANWIEVSFHSHPNAIAVNKLGQDGSGNPTWNGSTFPSGVSALSGLTDVLLGTLADGEVLVYRVATGKWQAENIASGASSLAGLSDVGLTSVGDGEILVYRNADHKWHAEIMAGGGAGSVIMDNAANLQGFVIPAGQIAFATDTGQVLFGDGLTLGGLPSTGVAPQVYDGGLFTDMVNINNIDGGTL